MPPSRHVVAATIRFLYRLRGLSLARWATALAPTPSGCGILKAREQELPAQGSRCGLGARTRSPRALARHFGSASARCARFCLRHLAHSQSSRCQGQQPAAWASSSPRPPVEQRVEVEGARREQLERVMQRSRFDTWHGSWNPGLNPRGLALYHAPVDPPTNVPLDC